MSFLAAAIGAVAAIAGTLISNNQNKKEARRAERRQDRLIQQQNTYNSPKSQMARYQEAGLNPNLMYGQGSPGNWSGGVPDTPRADYKTLPTPDTVGIMQAMTSMRLQESQTQLNQTKNDESVTKQDLMKSQKAVTDANPYLNAGYLNSVVSIMMDTAKQKDQQTTWMMSPSTHHDQTNGMSKMYADYQALLSRNHLTNITTENQAEQLKIQAEVLQSKQFQNDLMEMQVKWMKDTEINGNTIITFIKLFLQGLTAAK